RASAGGAAARPPWTPRWPAQRLAMTRARSHQQPRRVSPVRRTWLHSLFAKFLVEQAAYLLEIMRLQLRLPDVMQEQRADIAAEDPFDERTALVAHAAPARHRGPVVVSRAVDLVAQGALLDEPGEHRPDRAVVPAPTLGEGLDDLRRRRLPTLPDRL